MKSYDVSVVRQKLTIELRFHGSIFVFLSVLKASVEMFQVPSSLS